MKLIFNLILIFTMLAIMPGCGNNNSSSESVNSGLVNVSSSDRTIQSYIPESQKALQNRSSLTFNDMVRSSRLLLTSYGSLKAIEMSDGYHEIVKYRSFPIGDGWYFIEWEYMDGRRTNGWESYVKGAID